MEDVYLPLKYLGRYSFALPISPTTNSNIFFTVVVPKTTPPKPSSHPPVSDSSPEQTAWSGFLRTSLCCGCASRIEWFIAGRFLQGLGESVEPVVFAVCRDYFQKPEVREKQQFFCAKKNHGEIHMQTWSLCDAFLRVFFGLVNYFTKLVVKSYR